MTILFQTLLFLLGMALGVQMVASFFGLIDRGHTAGDLVAVVGNILLWAGLPVVIASQLGHPFRNAFLWGIGMFILIHIGNYFGTKALIRAKERFSKSV